MSIEELITISSSVDLSKDEFHRSYRQVMREHGLNEVAAIKNGTISFYEDCVTIRELLSRTEDTKSMEKAKLCAEQALFDFSKYDSFIMSVDELIYKLTKHNC